MLKSRLAVSILVWGLANMAQAGPISLTGVGYSQDFNTLYNVNGGTLGGGTVPNDSELTAAFFGSAGSGWWNGSGQTFGSATDGPLVNSQRMVSVGSSGSTERAITVGRQGAGTLGTGAQFQNDTGGTISELTISYKGEQWYRGNGADILSFEYSLNATTILDGGATWNAWTGLDFTAPNAFPVWGTGDGNLPANSANISDTVTGLSIPAGSTFFIRFTRNNDHGLAVDDFTITPGGGGGPTSGPPYFVTEPTVKPSALDGVPYSESLAGDVTEPDGTDTVTFTKLTGPAWLSVGGTGALTGTPDSGDAGLNILTVEASDVDGAATGTVHVSVGGTAPVFNAEPTIKSNGEEGVAYSGSLAGDITEPDGDTVTFNKLSGPTWLGVAGNGALSGTPGGGDVGLNVFSVEVSDVNGASTGTVHVTVDAEPPPPPPAGTANVDVNWNIEHSVGGISDFGRERHITVHSAVTDPDWDGQEDKLDYLMNDLDVYFGRDNGSATWKFANTPEDPMRDNFADLTFVTNWNAWWKTQYDEDVNRLQYESRATEMIMGHNPHPVYPTLSWYDNGFTWTGWQPLSIDASAEYITEYLDQAFRTGAETSGEQMPKYWEIINEPDMLLMTGQFMVSSWEALFDYHNMVATNVKARLGADAPMIGGFTWGQHDFQIADGVSRFGSNHFPNVILGGDPSATNGAEFYRQAGYTQWPDQGTNWDQWDKIWQGFVDHCGANMDFYSVHTYDWPGRGLGGTARLRTGGHVEGMLDIMEWYDVYKFGVTNRKPIVLSEYGSVAGYITASQNGPHVDWECLRPFNSMLMQFLERPDYIVKSMPFTPAKASWGDYGPTQRYPYKMLDETSYGNGDWQWTDYILWFELWADVDGTRVETQASDPDIQVDAYVNGDHAFLILNNLETEATLVNLHEFGLGTDVDSVRVKHLYCENYADYAGQTAYPVLDDYTLETAPGSVVIDPEATIIIRYNFASTHSPAATVVESKVYGEKLAPPGQLNPRGGEKFRVMADSFTGNINGVVVPSGAAEAILRISGSFVETTLTSPRPGLDYIRINGHDLTYATDWRGQEDGTAGGWGQLYTLEVSVPVAYLQANNVITGLFNNNANRYAAISLQIFDFSEQPGRYGVTATVPVTGVSIVEPSLSMPEQRQGSVTAVIAPSNATVKAITWTSDNESVATVDQYTGLITGVSTGTATITATTVDGGFTDNVTVTVSTFVPFEPESVRVNPANVIVLIGANSTSTATVLPENAADKSVTWSTSDPAVATVDSSGVITGVGEGTATITATTTVGGYTDTTLVTVPAPVAVTGVTVSPESGLIQSGSTLQLAASVQPVNAANPAVTWTSLNPSVVTVNASGLATAVSAGTAQIQVTTVDGGYTDISTLTVFVVGGGGVSLTIEAEDFDLTGGVQVYTHGTGDGINFVEANDWAEYNIIVPSNGIYQIEYYISTPLDGSTITFNLNGSSVATDAVPNNGDWDTFTTPLLSSGYVDMSAGPQTVRLVAGSNAWQWNLDKFVLTKVAESGGPMPGAGAVLIPQPLSGADFIIEITNGTASGTFDLLGTTSLTNPVSWSIVISNLVFDATGEATVTNPVTEAHQFFKVEEP